MVAGHDASPGSLSILIEWENVLVAAEDRCLRMLGELGKQVGAYDEPCEILILFDPEQISEVAISDIIGRHLTICPARDDVSIRTVPSCGMHYYDLRNLGVRLAKGEIIVCLDSDVIPEPGWLNALTAPIREDLAVDFVGGETHLDHRGSFFNKAFALGWIFPLRSTDTALHKANDRQFWANNMASRRSFILENPYPTDPRRHEARNACRRLRNQLTAKGVVIWHAGGAKVSHPAPEGWRRAMRHARVEGRDNAIIYAERGYGRVRRSLRAIGFALGRLKQATRNALWRDGPIRVPAWQVPGVLLVLAPYYLVTIAGAWAQAWLSERVWRHWEI